MASKDPRGLLKGLPRSIRIAGLDFKVKIVTPKQRPEIDDNNGLCLPDSREILLDAGMVATGEPSLILSIVVHEVTHGVNCMFGVTDASTEEAFTTNHTHGIVQLWLDNPRYVEWLSTLTALVRRDRQSEETS